MRFPLEEHSGLTSSLVKEHSVLTSSLDARRLAAFTSSLVEEGRVEGILLPKKRELTIPPAPFG
jgi:hypothetical protein